MSFVLQYRGDGLFRRRAHLEWIEPSLRDRARTLGWDGSTPLRFVDRDGIALGGLVPAVAA